MTELQQISEHVFWLPPGPPDRPSLGAVVGDRGVVMLDAGASDAHARLFLDRLAAPFAAETGRAPDEEMAWQLRAVLAGWDS